MNSDYKNLNFINLKDGSAKIEEIYTAANKYIKLRLELNKSMEESLRNGISVSETKKLFLLSEIIFNRRKLDIRIYENMLKTYATRLSKIEEELVFIEAQDQIREVSGFWNRHFGKK